MTPSLPGPETIYLYYTNKDRCESRSCAIAHYAIKINGKVNPAGETDEPYEITDTT